MQARLVFFLIQITFSCVLVIIHHASKNGSQLKKFQVRVILIAE